MANPTPADEDCNAALTELRQRFPHATFLALGQTALWDEPTKATLLRRLESCWPEAALIAGVHDTDYFAKLHTIAAPRQSSPFALVPHDDHRTRALWSAAGEMSRLFGSEDVPTRALLQQEAGVSLKTALRFSDDPDALLSTLTEAWGWTGIIRAGGEREIAAEVKLAEILPTLLEQLAWATEGSPVGESLREWTESFAQSQPEATLPDLYAALLPQLYGLLLRETPRQLSTTRTSELLRFNTQTYAHPRFWLVETFLNPATRAAAHDAYDTAVAGGEQYPLEEFGPGARPFDLIVPGRGRGTLRVRADGSVWIDTPQPIHLPGDRVVTSAKLLAERIEAALGPDCVLVGKAIALLPMLAAEWVLVFHEGASSYSDRTRGLMRSLRQQRVPAPPLRPILRVRYATWDSLAALAGVTLTLPPHLRQALGRDRIDADDFAACWRRGIAWERQRLKELSEQRAPKALMAYLGRFDRSWPEQLAQYSAAQATLLALRGRGIALQAQERDALAQEKTLRAERAALQQAKGDDFRARGSVLDTAAVAERTARFDEPMAALGNRAQALAQKARQLRAERKALERGPETVAARESLRRSESAAERARAQIAKNALQTIHGLPHTDYRPSAWWFPHLSPNGEWFERVVQTARLRLEELSS